MRHRVLLIFTVGFASGISLASLFSINWIFCASLCVVCLAILCLSEKGLPWIVFIAGIALGAFRLISYFPPGWNVESFAGPAPVTIVGKIITDPNIEQHKATFVISIDEIKTRQGSYLIKGATAVLVHGAAISRFEGERYGDDVRLSGMLQSIFPVTNPGEFDWRTYQIHRGVSGELIVQRPFGAAIVDRPGVVTEYEHWSSRTERYFEGAFAGALPADEAGVLAGILFGDRRGITPELQREFAATGTAHVLATAGLHIGIVAICLSALIAVLPFSRKAGSLFIIILLWAFACLAGARPPVVRAVSAATLYFGGRLFNRAPDSTTTIAAAAFGILLVEPPALFDSDFQLSFVTVCGLVIFMDFWNEFWKSRIEILQKGILRTAAVMTAELAGFSMIAQISATPLTILYFSQFSVLSLPVNIVVVPLLFLLIPAAILTLLLLLTAPAIGVHTAYFVLHPLLWTIMHTVGWFSNLPFCFFAVAQPPAWLIVAVYGAVFAAGLKWRSSSGTKHPRAMEAGTA
jgi:competence protein ComEC